MESLERIVSSEIKEADAQHTDIQVQHHLLLRLILLSCYFSLWMADNDVRCIEIYIKDCLFFSSLLETLKPVLQELDQYQDGAAKEIKALQGKC